MGALAALLEGMVRFMLFSSNGVVIIKIMSSTNARSSRGVTLISLKVEKLLRLEYRFISLLRHPERSRRIPLNSPLSFRAGIRRLRFASTGMTSSRELANAHVVLDVFKLERSFADGPFHRRADRVHLRRGNFIRDAETGTKSFIYFRRAKQMKREFLTASPVDVKDGCADKARISLEQAERLSILSEGFEKAPRLLSRELDHAHFCDHDRPAENRADGEGQQDDLHSDGGLLTSAKETS